MGTEKRRLLLILLLTAALGLLVACGGTTASNDVGGNAGEAEVAATAAPADTPTSEPEPTDTPAPEPTEEPAPTATTEPEATATSAPEPTAEPEMEANALEVADQELSADNTVTIPLVDAAVDGWLVVHAGVDGAPGPVIGFAPVSAGQTAELAVPVDAAGATETVFAMLHVDEGTAGVYEFPGPDGPARDSADAVVVTPFALSGLPENAVSVVSQLASDANTVVVPAVRAAQDGWIVIHSDADGAPGPVAGYAAVSAGTNYEVTVELDPAVATETLHAMLHVDAGTAGEYEFPGDDGPVQDADGNIVMLPFQVVESVSAIDTEFVPAVLRVPAGTTLMWQNDGQFPHTVTADSEAFDSGQMQTGDTFEFTFESAGSYAYYCELHGGPGGAGMSGTIIVVPSG